MLLLKSGDLRIILLLGIGDRQIMLLFRHWYIGCFIKSLPLGDVRDSIDKWQLVYVFIKMASIGPAEVLKDKGETNI